MCDIEIRPILSESHREASYRLAYDIYIEELGQDVHGCTNHEQRMVIDPLHGRSRLLGAWCGDELVGTMAILWGGDGVFPDFAERCFGLSQFTSFVAMDKIAIFARFMVKSTYRGGPVVMQLARAGFGFAIDQGAHLMFADCQPHLVSTYEKFGFRPYRRAYNDPGLGLMVPIIANFADFDVLEGCDDWLRALVPPHVEDAIMSRRVRALLRENERVCSASEGDVFWSRLRRYMLSGERWELLSELTMDERRLLLSRSQLLPCHRGDRIVVKGQATRTIYLVLQGRVEVQIPGQLAPVKVLQQGDVFGEIAFLLQRDRTADVLAGSDDTCVLTIGESTLRKLSQTAPGLYAKILLSVSRSLAQKVVGAADVVALPEAPAGLSLCA